MKFQLPNFDHFRPQMPEFNEDLWDEIQEGMVTMEDVIEKLQEHNGLLKESNEQLIRTLETQHSENTKLSSSNTRLTVLTIILAVLFWIPGLVGIFKEDYNHAILLEQREQNRLLQMHTSELNNMSDELDSLHDQLLNSQGLPKTDISSDEKQIKNAP